MNIVYLSCKETLLSHSHEWGYTAWLVHQHFGDGINALTHRPISLLVPLVF